MRIVEIKLCPFAGLAGTCVRFDQNLTVVRGDNEAGKSTIFKALESVLFMRTDLTPARMRDFVRPYLPVGGGDTIAVELRFVHEGAAYCLRRQWGGASPAAHLTLPDGSLVTGEDAITGRVEAMLAVSPGTYRSVLLARQSGLGQTLDALKAEAPGALRDLGDLLNSAVQATDGVSVDAFKSRLQEQYDAYFSHWDTAQSGPEGRRGLQNPWKKQVGLILQAWYEKETACKARDEAVSIEQRIDELNARLAVIAASSTELEGYVKQHAAAAASVAERRTIEAEEELVGEQLVKHKQANAEWPVLDQVLADLGRQRAALAGEVDKLKAETGKARQIEDKKGLADQLKRADLRRKQLEEARKALAAAPALGDDVLRKITETASRIRELQAQLAGGRLKASFTAREPLSVTLQCGVDAPAREQLAAGQLLPVAADGTFRLEHAQWTLEVESGSGGFAGIARDLEASRQSLADLLRAHGAADEEAARRLHAACDNARRAVIDAERNLADELGGKTYEELAAGVATDGDAASVRPLAELTGLLAGAAARLDGLDRELAAKAGRVDELKRSFGDQDKLFEKVVDITARRKALDGKRAALPPLPAGVSDPAAFAAEYQQKAAGLDSQRREKNQLEVDRAGIHMPADSAEELKAQCRDLEEAFNATLRKAHAIARIRQAVAEAEQAAPGANPYAGLKATLEGYIARMTDKRYEAIQMAESLPSGFVRKDGKVVGADLLSTGTRDVLGLAIRLAMAGCLLGGREGFLVMDDPLVDMDPRRQAAAADLLSEYARERQLIVFTCHPAHSEKLGGAGVEI